MERRKFLKKAGLASLGLAASPYILPSGRLFAATGSRMVNHVVFCLFAGGVRDLESIQKAEGNLMPHILSGTEPISGDISGSMDPLPGPSGPRLQEFGTLYKGFKYSTGPTGHINGHNAVITGRYNDTSLNLLSRPEYPTLFEYYRKHYQPERSALDAWWISNQLGPYPDLNYSNYPGYGPLYGANFLAPLSMVSQEGYDAVGSPTNFDPDEKDQINQLQKFFNGNFQAAGESLFAGVPNTREDREALDAFLSQTYQEALAGVYTDPWGVGASMNGDMYNLFFAEKVMEAFKPELMVVNMFDVDVAHQNFTQYCNNLRKADYALAHLWNTIQSTPGMANDTLLIAVPEHGRNLEANTIQDANGRFALDHTGDEMSRSIFCLVAGPNNVVNQNQVIQSTTGETIDIVPTIAKALGFDQDIPGGMLPGRFLNEAFL